MSYQTARKSGWLAWTVRGLPSISNKTRLVRATNQVDSSLALRLVSTYQFQARVGGETSRCLSITHLGAIGRSAPGLARIPCHGRGRGETHWRG